jgi:hypothetical protein
MTHPTTVGSIARFAIHEVAPEDAEALELYLTAYENDPKIIQVAERKGADSTGFGESFESLVPYVVVVCQFALQQVAIGAAVDMAKEGLRQRLRKLRSPFKKARPPKVDASVVARLTPEQLVRVRDASYRKARHMRMSEKRAALLADAIVGALAVAPE